MLLSRIQSAASSSHCSAAAIEWPFAAIAQRSGVRRVCVLANEPWPPLEGLRDGMRALGYIDERGLHFSTASRRAVPSAITL